jgi:histidine triad (HIT) family protein
MTDTDCLFCQMATGTFPVDKLYDDGLAFAIRDINPRAPTHLLIIPKEHISTAHHLTINHGPLLGHLFGIAAKQMEELGFAERGYRLTINVGPDGGQTVYHLHMHVLAGRPLGAEAQQP